MKEQSHTLRNIGIIISREYKNRVYQRSFIISTAVILVLALVATCIPTIIQYFASTAKPEQTKLLVLNNAGPIANLQDDGLKQYISTSLNGTTTDKQKAQYAISMAPTNNITTAQAQVKENKQNILLVLERDANQDLRFTHYTKSSNITDTKPLSIQTMASQLNVLDKSSRIGLKPEQTQSLFAQPNFKVESLAPPEENRTEEQVIAGIITAYAGIVLIFMSVYMYGYGVATGVAEEKGSRIMEILINAATPFQLMVGKIIGIGAAGLTQMVALVVVGITGFLLQTPLQIALLGSSSNLNVDLANVSIVMLGLLLVYFVLGFALYATLFAALGALVNRQDEAQNATAPIMWILMIGYFISFIGFTDTNATWLKVVSYIPFWTPTTMLMRIGSGSTAPWEIALSMAIMVVAIAICSVISARIYRYGILMYGQKPNVLNALKVIRAK